MIRTGKLRKFEALGAHVSLPTPESPRARAQLLRQHDQYIEQSELQSEVKRTKEQAGVSGPTLSPAPLAQANPSIRALKQVGFLASASSHPRPSRPHSPKYPLLSRS